MEYIFEGNWVYLAHESQLPQPHDFFTTTIGRQPVILMRNQAGAIGGFINTCPHRGATVCLAKRGNRQILTCPYHGWSFNTNGGLVRVKDHASGAYPASFEGLDHGLARLPRLVNYRGFLFGSLNPDVPDLEVHLGAARNCIDMLVDQAPQGLEILQGSADYTYVGNWKLQAENGVDGYHCAGSRATSGEWNAPCAAQTLRPKLLTSSRTPAPTTFEMKQSFTVSIGNG